MKYSIIALFIGLLISACSEYQTQYEGPYVDGQAAAVTYEILFVENGTLRMANENLTRVKTLRTSSTVAKASINFSHDRIAYKPTVGTIVVMDTSGNVVGNVPNSSSVVWFDWHPNNQTLYMLNANNILSFYGPSVTVATTNLSSRLPIYGGSKLEIQSVAIMANGNVVCGVNPEIFPAEKGVWVFEPGGKNNHLRTNFHTPARIRLSALDNFGYMVSSDGIAYHINLRQGSYFISEIFSGFRYLVPSPRDEDIAVSSGTQNLNRIYLYNGQRQLDVSGTVTDLDW